MSIQTARAPRTVGRRNVRVTSHCAIWDLVAPHVPCPACDDGFTDRLDRATRDQQARADGPTPTRGVVEVPVEDAAAASSAAQQEAVDLLRMLAH